MLYAFGSHVAGIAGGMTIGANGSRSGSDHGIAGMSDAVIAVAGYTSRKRGRLECCLVRAGFKQLRLKDVTSRTHILHGCDPGRGRPMISMTGRAGRRAQISTCSQRFVVNTRTVGGELIRWNRVSLHVIGIGMAARTGLRNVQRMNVGAAIARGP